MGWNPIKQHDYIVQVYNKIMISFLFTSITQWKHIFILR